MDIFRNNIVFVSACISSAPASVNLAQHFVFKQRLLELRGVKDVIECTGVWESQLELTLGVVLEEPNASLVKALATISFAEYEQACVLFKLKNGECWLEGLDNDWQHYSQFIGIWQPTDKVESMGTLIGGQWYVAK